MVPGDHTDTALLQRMVAGDEMAFQQVLHLYKHKLYFTLLRLTDSEALAQDGGQNIFIRLLVGHASLGAVRDLSGPTAAA